MAPNASDDNVIIISSELFDVLQFMIKHVIQQESGQCYVFDKYMDVY